MAKITSYSPKHPGIEKNLTAVQDPREVPRDDKYESDSSSTHKQDGVKQVEAITSVWTSKTLILMFVLLYLVSFVDMLLVSVQSSLNPYVTSSFGRHGLLATTSIVATILGGSAKLAIAKIIDVWGRVEGFLVMLLIIVIGHIMKATCQNVETYAAAQTLYWVAHLGLMYVIDVMIADFTTLRNRMIMFGINGTPTIASGFAGPRIAELFYKYSTFRWAFGAFVIMLVGVCLPTAAVILMNQRKANAVGLIPEKNSNRNWLQSTKHYIIEFDVVGIILTSAGFSLILLPFSLASSSANKWRNGSIISMIVIGVVCLVAFVVWEKYFAPVKFFLFKYLTDRTIIGSCILYGVMFTSIFCWNTYYSSYLQVVHSQTITHAGYILDSFSLSAAFITPFIGLAIRYTGDFKWTAYVGVPFMLLGAALLIPLRTPNTHVGLLVMVQIMNGIGSALFATCGQLAVMAAVNHQETAVVLALWGLFGSIGASVGLTVAGALWTNILPASLEKNLPEGSKNLSMTIYASLETQLSYPIGDPIRTGIVAAYADVQRKMAIAGSALIPILLISIIMWRNINVKRLEETKGPQVRGNVW